MPVEIVQVDAFTAKPFRGNPAAVCLLEKPGDEEWMKFVAREMNLSETAFLYPIDGGYHLRWLTPKDEVDLCGHGTLATAHLLYEDGHLSAEETANFKTRSGWVSVTKNDDWLEMDFPAYAPTEIDPTSQLLKALGVAVEYVGKYPSSYLVRVASADVVRQLQPNLDELEQLSVKKVCITATDDSGEADFVSRLFAPKLGIPEDPVNGNSHTALTPYWSNVLGKDAMTSHYLSNRGGEIRVRLEGERVKICGQSKTVMRARLLH